MQDDETNSSIPRELWATMVQQACLEVKLETDKRRESASQFSADEFFNQIIDLPLDTFRLVASKIGEHNYYALERGICWSIAYDKFEKMRNDLRRLESMGLIYRSKSSTCAYMNFDSGIIIDKLAQDKLGVGRLLQHAKDNNIKLIA